MKSETVRRTEDYIFSRGRSGQTHTNGDPLISYTYRGALDGRNGTKLKSKSQKPEVSNTTDFLTKTYWVNSHAQTSQNFQSTLTKSVKQVKQSNFLDSAGATDGRALQTNSTIRIEAPLQMQTFTGKSAGSTGPFTQHLKHTNQFLSTANSTALPTVQSSRAVKKDPVSQDDGISALYNVEQWMEMKKMRRSVSHADNRMKIDDILLLARKNNPQKPKQSEDRIVIPNLNDRMMDSIMRHTDKVRRCGNSPRHFREEGNSHPHGPGTHQQTQATWFFFCRR